MITQIDKDTFKITYETFRIVKLSELKKELERKRAINADIDKTTMARSTAKVTDLDFYKTVMPREDTKELETLIKQLEAWGQ
jgi:hypothetical protein